MFPHRLIEPAFREFDLLARCARVDGGKENYAVIRRLAASGVEWDTFLKQASKHGLLAIVSPRLKAADCEGVPAFVLDRLDQAFEENTCHNLHLARALVRALATLNERKVRALPYKGPVLSQTVYGNLNARESSDLDLLVAEAEVPAAIAALVDVGYRMSPSLSPWQQAAALRSNCEFVLHDPVQRVFIDLHWRIAPRQFAIDLEFNDLHDRCNTITLGGATIRSLAAEDLLLVLAVHAAKHSWELLCWVRDVSAVIGSNPEIDWQRLLTNAKRVGALRILLISLHLCQELLESELHPLVLAAIAADSEVAGVGQVVIKRMRSADSGIPALKVHRLLLRTRSRWWDKAEYVTRVIFTPGVSEWSVLALPPMLAPFYPFVRLLRVAARLMQGTAPRPSTALEPRPPAQL